MVEFVEKRVIEILHSFPINSTNLEILSEIIKLDNGRLLFAEVLLNHFEKHKLTGNPEHLRKSSFDLLSDIIWKLLNHSHSNFDFISTLVIMKLSCIYCNFEKETRNTTYLYEVLRNHQIWSSSSYWEGAFFIEIARLRSNTSNLPPSILPFIDKHTLSLDWVNMNDEQRKDGLAYEEDLLFATLTSFIDYMIKFGKSVNAVRGFIGSIADLAQLSYDHSRMLVTLIDNLHQVRRLSEKFVSVNETGELVDFLPTQLQQQQVNPKIVELFHLFEAKR